MTQSTITLINQTHTAYRSAHNAANQTLASNFAGASEPSSPVARQFWFDETAGYLKIRNAGNTAWDRAGPPPQDQTHWDTGTGTTESTITATKLKAAILTHSPPSQAWGGWEVWETVYDYAVSGAAASATSSLFEDGYEYMFILEGVQCSNSSGRNLRVRLLKDTSSSWTGYLTISSANDALEDDYWGQVVVEVPRNVTHNHVVRYAVAEDANNTPQTDGIVDIPTNQSIGTAIFTLATADKTKKISFSWSSYNLNGGRILGFRRPV
jgi:hypothetical protein